MIDCKLHTVSRLPLDNPPEPRFWHRSCVADGCLYVFGGSGITGNGTSDIVKLDLRHLTNPDMFGDVRGFRVPPCYAAAFVLAYPLLRGAACCVAVLFCIGRSKCHDVCEWSFVIHLPLPLPAAGVVCDG